MEIINNTNNQQIIACNVKTNSNLEDIRHAAL